MKIILNQVLEDKGISQNKMAKDTGISTATLRNLNHNTLHKSTSGAPQRPSVAAGLRGFYPDGEGRSVDAVERCDYCGGSPAPREHTIVALSGESNPATGALKILQLARYLR